MPAIQAAADLARLLGHDTQHAVATRAAEDSKVETIQAVADWIEEKWLRRMAPDAREKFLKELRGLG